MMMTDPTPLSDQELHEIESALQSGRLQQDDRCEAWVRRILAELKRLRGTSTPGDDAPDDAGLRKRHGDALLDQSGTRHGADARPR